MSVPAAGVAWRQWGEAAFAAAAAEAKPILLSLTATWCQWCHEMDRLCYRDPAIVALITDRFVPVRVDTDRRPDINERYNLGGWPTTVFLTPDGRILGGGTYIPRDRLGGILAQIADAFRDRRAEIDAARPDRLSAVSGESPSSGEPDAEAVEWLSQRLLDEFDPEHGGFGLEPKFPHTDALAFAIARYRETADARFEQIVLRSLDAMGWGGLYDKIDGGFFRYSTTRDWTLPHSEKMLEDNAALIRLYLDAAVTFDRVSYRERAAETLRYVHGTLRDPLTGTFFPSQRADRRYYLLESLEARRAVVAPAVDRSEYVAASAAMADAYLRAAAVLDDPSLRDIALAALDRLVMATYRPGLGVARSPDPDSVRGLLVDQVGASAALVEAYGSTGQIPYLEMAQELMLYAIRVMWDEAGGGFLDRAESATAGDAWGLLGEPLKPCALNCQAAIVLMRLEQATGDPALRTHALATLAAMASAYRQQGLHGALYGLALYELSQAVRTEVPRLHPGEIASSGGDPV